MRMVRFEERPSHTFPKWRHLTDCVIAFQIVPKSKPRSNLTVLTILCTRMHVGFFYFIMGNTYILRFAGARAAAGGAGVGGNDDGLVVEHKQ